MTNTAYTAYTMERHLRIYNNETGEFVSVSSDADGLDLVEIRQYDRIGNITQRIAIPDEQAIKLVQALKEYLNITD